VVEVVAEFERGAGRRVAEGLHLADHLIGAEGRVSGAALLIGDDPVDGVRDVLLELRDYRRPFVPSPIAHAGSALDPFRGRARQGPSWRLPTRREGTGRNTHDGHSAQPQSQG
jgi:hypothetical protein